MSRRAALGLVLIGLTPACEREVAIWPELPSTVHSVLLLLRSEAGVRVLAAEPSTPSTQLWRDEGELELYVLGHEKSLAQLGLASGELQLGAESDSPLPNSDLILQTTVSGSSAGPFNELETLPDSIAELHLALSSARDCLLAGACLAAPDTHGFTACLTPCDPIAAPAPPLPPEALSFEPCPSGWLAGAWDEQSVCLPFPDAALVCPPGQRQRFGQAACERLGPSCPSRFASDLPSAAPILYVDPLAPAGGDGSLLAPHSTLAAAFALGTPGTVYALAVGSYDEPMVLDGDQIVWGACPEGSHLQGAPGARALTIGRGHAQVHNLGISGGERTLVLTGADSVLELDHVAIGASRFGPWVEAGTLRATDVTLDQGPFFVTSGGHAELTRVRVHSSAGPAIAVHSASLIAHELSVITSSQTGIQVERGQVSLALAYLQVDQGIAVSLAADSTATIADVLVRGILGSSGVRASGSRVSIDRFLADHLSSPVALYQGSRGRVDRLLARDASAGGLNPDSGHGVLLIDSTIELHHARLTRATWQNILVDGPQAQAWVEDVFMDGYNADDGVAYGRGMAATRSGQLDIRRVEMRRQAHTALQAITGGRVDAEDVYIEATEPSGGIYGRAVELSGGAVQASLSRLLIERAYNAGMLVSHDASLDAHDVQVRQIELGDCLGCITSRGDGVSAAVGGRVDLERFRLEGAVGAGVRIDQDSTVSLRRGVLSGNAIGVHSPDGYPLAGHLEQVLLESNGTPIFP